MKQSPQDEYFERLERYRKFNSDQKVLAVLQNLGQMGFTEFDKNMKLCMETGSNLDVILDRLMPA
jgi:hypothetical protein